MSVVTETGPGAAETTLDDDGRGPWRIAVALLALGYPAVALHDGFIVPLAAINLLPVAVAAAALGSRAGLVFSAWSALWTLTAWVLYTPPPPAGPALTLSACLAGPALAFIIGSLRDARALQQHWSLSRHEDAQRLATLERRGRVVLEALPDTIYRLDRAGKLQDLQLSLPGERDPSFVGRNVRDVLPGPVAEQLVEGTNEALRTGSTFTFEFQRDDLDATLHEFEARVVRASEQEAICIIRDVTALHALSKQLASARDDALIAAGTKGRMLATMSHQIRTPMNGVVGMANVLLQTKLSPEQHEFTTIIRNSGEALLSILDDVLDVSQLEDGEVPLEKETFALRATLEEVIDLLSAKAHDRGLEVANLIDLRVPDRMRGDSGRLRQVVTNLLGNAIKFTDEGQVVLRVTVVGHDRDQARIRFDVTDTGCGITREQQKRLFQDFSQGDRAIARQYGGTGLGLVISQQIVAAMGGHMAVESTPGQGSTFSFTVRIETLTGQTTGGFLLPRALSGARVLSGPLHPLTAAVLQHELSPLGAHLEQVDQLAALGEARTRRGDFDLVLVELPLSASEDEAHASVEMAVRAAGHLPVCALHGLSKRSCAEAARSAGAALCLARPLHRDALLEGFGNLLGISPRRPSRSGRKKVSAGHAQAKVLVVEDNLVNQKVAVRTLELLGCHAEVADNGALALEALAQRQFDVVLMDCQMPVLDGFETTRRLRGSETGEARLPVVAMTASASTEDRERCLAAGMDDHVTKPVTVDALDRTLRRWLPASLDYGARRPESAGDEPIREAETPEI